MYGLVRLFEAFHLNVLFLHEIRVQGSVGFLLSIAGVLSIQVTSPITHMISSAVRGVAASILGVAIFGDILTS
jgi:GDP-fucose transporter C1